MLTEKKENRLMPVEDMTDVDKIKACIGKNEDNSPKSSICITLQEYTGGENEFNNEQNYKEISFRFLDNAILDIEPRNAVVRLRLKFKSAVDPELKTTYSILENFGKLTSFLNNTEDKQYFISFSVMPKDYLAEIMLNFLNPIMWTTEPETIGVPANNIISIYFPIDNFFISDTGDDAFNEIDLKKMHADAIKSTRRGE